MFWAQKGLRGHFRYFFGCTVALKIAQGPPELQEQRKVVEYVVGAQNMVTIGPLAAEIPQKPRKRPKTAILAIFALFAESRVKSEPSENTIQRAPYSLQPPNAVLRHPNQPAIRQVRPP